MLSTRFTRVTVVADRRRLDISLPADVPLAGQLPTVLRLLSVPTESSPRCWRLAAPEFGALPPQRTLDEAGVLDGALLYLTEADTAPPPPFVDDVERVIAQTVADTAPAWAGQARRSAVGGLLAVVLLAMVGVGLVSPGPVGWIAPALALAAALMAGSLLPGRGGLAAGLAGVPAGLAVVYGIAAARASLIAGAADPAALQVIGASTSWVGFRLLLAMTVTAVLAGLFLLRRSAGGATCSLVLFLVAGLALLADRLGMPAVRTAGIGLVLAVLITGVAGRLALGGTGLVGLMAADEQGVPVPRASVLRSVRRGLAVTGGVVWAGVVVGALSVWELITAPAGWVGPALGVLGGLVFALRARMFSRAAQVAPMLVVGVLAVVAVAVAAPGWIGGGGAVSLAVLAGLVALTVAAGLTELSTVTGARTARLLERVELVAVLALVPALVLLFRTIPAVQRWWVG